MTNDQGGRGRMGKIASRRLASATRWRDALFAVAAGAAVLGFVVYAVLNLSRQAASPGMVEGIIVSKEFVPQPEEQISVGSGGLKARRVAGEYHFRVRVPSENNREYTVTADARTYESRGVGERMYFKTR